MGKINAFSISRDCKKSVSIVFKDYSNLYRQRAKISFKKKIGEVGEEYYLM